jgi:threonine aldolase
MFFTSDNWAGAHETIANALVKQADTFQPSYGISETDRAAHDSINQLFEREVSTFFVATGTAANALALASVNRPGGVAFCHCEAHIIEDECGAPEFFTNGARLRPIDGPLGKIDASQLAKALEQFPHGSLNAGQLMAVSITQATEVGALYTLEEIREISKIAKQYGLPLHMDGARFANAIAATGCTPAQMTWESGVDILSFGGTKNGCWCAEALIFMDPAHADGVPFLHKRSAHLFSKSRFVAAQFDAYLKDNLWLELAEHANKMAKLLAQEISASTTMRLAWPCEANEVFAIMKKAHAEKAQKAGAHFYDWPAPRGMESLVADDEYLVRLVTSFATTPEQISQFAELI